MPAVPALHDVPCGHRLSVSSYEEKAACSKESDAGALAVDGSPAEADLLQRLRAGDRAAFAEIVQAWSAMLLRVALLYVSTRASAEEVVQDTWLAVIQRLGRFEGRSSLRTWVFRILENQARTRGVRESRSMPSPALPQGDDVDAAGPAVDPTRFSGTGDPWPGHWTTAGAPTPWQPLHEDAAVASEIRRELRAALASSPTGNARWWSARRPRAFL
jgi:RNA polymerase sigma-70 factor, ECF subfamily